jgi:hypothetical protein
VGEARQSVTNGEVFNPWLIGQDSSAVRSHLQNGELMKAWIVQSITRANALDPILCPHIMGFTHFLRSPSSRLAGFLSMLAALGCVSSPATRTDAAADDTSSPDQLADLSPSI